MSFWARTKNDSEEWHINGHKPLFTEEFVAFRADGDELEFLRNRFNNIPITKGNICVWRGDIASFIFENFE